MYEVSISTANIFFCHIFIFLIFFIFEDYSFGSITKREALFLRRKHTAFQIIRCVFPLGAGLLISCKIVKPRMCVRATWQTKRGWLNQVEDLHAPRGSPRRNVHMAQLHCRRMHACTIYDGGSSGGVRSGFRDLRFVRPQQVHNVRCGSLTTSLTSRSAGRIFEFE